MKLNSFYKIIEPSSRQNILVLMSVIFIGISLRMYYFPYDIPLVMDSLLYFKYALDTSILGELPNQFLNNNGWPIFLSVFFSIPFSESFMDYMNLQRVLTVVFSVITAIPIYFLCKKFVEPRLALIGALLFLLEPRIIQQSVTGVSEPLYILLITSSLVLFFSKQKYQYISFALVGFSTLVRYEGIVLFFALILIFLINNRKNVKQYFHVIPMIGIFILVLLPMSFLQLENFGQEGIFSKVVAGGNVLTKESSTHSESAFSPVFYFQNSIIQLVKFLVWSWIPIFILFVPLGLILVFKKNIENKVFLICTGIFLMIPAFYAYSRGIEEIRYLIVLYPILCVISLFPIREVTKKIKKQNLFLGIIIFSIIISSMGFLEYKKIDNIHEYEAYQISKKVVEVGQVINTYYPESKYIRTGGMHNETLLEISSKSLYEFDSNHHAKEFENLKDFIVQEKLTHLVIDGHPDRAKFLNEIFHNENEFPFLIKIFDSKNEGYDYHVKIFEINYNLFR